MYKRLTRAGFEQQPIDPELPAQRVYQRDSPPSKRPRSQPDAQDAQQQRLEADVEDVEEPAPFVVASLHRDPLDLFADPSTDSAPTWHQHVSTRPVRCRLTALPLSGLPLATPSAQQLSDAFRHSVGLGGCAAQLVPLCAATADDRVADPPDALLEHIRCRLAELHEEAAAPM